MTLSPDITFEQAYARLQEIHTLVSTPDKVNLDAMFALQTEAKELHDFLQARLGTVAKDLSSLSNS